MALQRYLAMTGAEILENSPIPHRVAWLSCRFQQEGAALEGVSSLCPEGAMLIVTDEQLPTDPEAAAEAVLQCQKEMGCESILLDFQRETHPILTETVRRIVGKACCPVGVPPIYAETESRLFLPPVPPNLTVEEYLQPWKGREIWLEAALNGMRILLAKDGARITSLERCSKIGPHFDPQLCCHYRIQVEETEAAFVLSRTREDLEALLLRAEELGICRAIGLFQEMG